MASLWQDPSGLGAAAAQGAPSVRLVDGSRYDAVVIGAGITGLTTAVMLAHAGRSVAVVEARSVGAVTTGASSAKVSLLQGAKLSRILAHHPVSTAAAYLDANRDGQDWLLRFCLTHDVAVERRDAVSYAATGAGVETVDAEALAAASLGLKVKLVDSLDVSFPVSAAVVLPEQFQVDPMAVLRALGGELRRHGGVVFESTTVTDVHAGPSCRVETTAGALEAGWVVLATGTPFLDRGLYFAKLSARRSYCIAVSGVTDLLPPAMYLSVDTPTRSLRTADVGAGGRLVVGGNGHDVGRHPSPRSLVDDLEAWTARYFPGAVRTHAWSAQDYESHNQIPFVGKLPRGRGHVFIATGFDKWGMTNGPAAALRICSEIVGDRSLPWAKVLATRLTMPTDLAEGVVENARVGVRLAHDWAAAELAHEPLDAPAEGHGVVASRGTAPVAVSTVGGETCAVSAVCPHLGGIVAWNDAESSWDCPLHGSRFAATGERLEGPATHGLARVTPAQGAAPAGPSVQQEP